MNRLSMTKNELTAKVDAIPELYLSTYSPGDGVTRYRFSIDDGDYFGVSDYSRLYTALGLAEASVWLSGFIAGRRVANMKS